MALQVYSQAEIYINGAKLAEEAQVSVNRRSNAQPVNTVAKGYAGDSPGAAMTEIKVTNAVPSAAFELNPGPFILNLQVCEITIYAAGLTLTQKGFIYEDNFSHAVNSEARLEFSARCEPADWK
jgi:hypothetical protein